VPEPDEYPISYLLFDGMCWPDPTDPRESEWRLRYRPDSITRKDQMALASVMHAYRYLIGLDSRTRQQRVMQIRAALRAPVGVSGA
jgi:hypothetical protein